MGNMEPVRDLGEKLTQVRERVSALEGAQKDSRVWIGVIVSVLCAFIAAGISIAVALIDGEL